MTTTLDRMASQLSEWEHLGDGRAVFLDCYCNMTEAVLDSVERGAFVDGVWVSALLDRFAGYYFDSIDGGPAGRTVPEPWILAHAAAVGEDAHPMQLLLAGVNAHINYDLVVTLVDLLDDDWASSSVEERSARRRDYDAINDVIADTADLVQDVVLGRRAPWLDLADRWLGRWDERGAVRLLSAWRAQVWRHAVTILDEPDEGNRAEVLGAIERHCTRRARWLLL